MYIKAFLNTNVCVCVVVVTYFCSNMFVYPYLNEKTSNSFYPWYLRNFPHYVIREKKASEDDFQHFFYCFECLVPKNLHSKRVLDFSKTSKVTRDHDGENNVSPALLMPEVSKKKASIFFSSHSKTQFHKRPPYSVLYFLFLEVHSLTSIER